MPTITSTNLLLIFLASSLVGIDSMLDQIQLHRPIITCPLIGWIIGDINSGIKIGGSLELLSLGWINVGASVSPDYALSSVVSTLLFISSKLDIGSSISLSVPVATLGQILNIIIRSLTIYFQHWADKIIENKKNKFYISLIHISALILHSLRVSIPSLLVALLIKNQLIINILNIIPDFITNGFKLAGDLMIIIGYSMILNMIKEKHLMPFFCLGFLISGLNKVNLLSAGLIGFILSIIYIQLSPKYYDYKNKKNNNIKKDKTKDDELD